MHGIRNVLHVDSKRSLILSRTFKGCEFLIFRSGLAQDIRPGVCGDQRERIGKTYFVQDWPHYFADADYQ